MNKQSQNKTLCNYLKDLFISGITKSCREIELLFFFFLQGDWIIIFFFVTNPTTWLNMEDCVEET